MTLKNAGPEKVNRFRKFQKSKLPSVVKTKSKTKIIEVEVPIDESARD